MYFARTSDRKGRKRQHAFAETREAAARLVFKTDPKAMKCSTSQAHKQPDGRMFDTGSGMIWHSRSEIEV